MSDPLATYLHDHLGGARAPIDLLEAMRDGHKEHLPVNTWLIHPRIPGSLALKANSAEPFR